MQLIPSRGAWPDLPDELQDTFMYYYIGEITISSIRLPTFQNHVMTYNIILLFFTISSISKCQFLNHTQPLYKVTISSICLALLCYIIHVLVLAPAIFIFHSTCHTWWCTTPPNEGEASHCHVVFHHCICSSVVAPALCHWQRYTHHRVSRWSFFSARLKWFLNALSLGSIIVCLVISLKIG